MRASFSPCRVLTRLPSVSAFFQMLRTPPLSRVWHAPQAKQPVPVLPDSSEEPEAAVVDFPLDDAAQMPGVRMYVC